VAKGGGAFGRLGVSNDDRSILQQDRVGETPRWPGEAAIDGEHAFHGAFVCHITRVNQREWNGQAPIGLAMGKHAM
jgi:hypothetical protein